MLGGATGNLLSRLYQGTVTDFVSVGGFAVFNVADASISIGAALLVVSMWVDERRAKERDEVDSVEENVGRNLEGHSE
jgi:signal peptidase II